MGCTNNVIEEVPDERAQDEDVVDAQHGHSASQWFWCFLGGVMEDLETDRVVELLPVNLGRLLMVAPHLIVRLCVFHLNLQIISCYTPTAWKMEDQADGLEMLVLLLMY